MNTHRTSLRVFVAVSIGLAGCGGGGNGMMVSSGGAGGFGSGGNDVGGTTLGGLDPLPGPITVENETFTTADRCGMCHSASDVALRDAAGRDVSPYALWRRSMMGFSGRDPYWLAAFSHELADNPGAKDTIEATCTRCHAPAAAVTLAKSGLHIGLDDITTNTSNVAHLAREGVGCAVCHQIKPDNFGQPSSFTGQFIIGTERLMYGPHMNPFTMPMKNNVNFTPTYSNHMTDSGLCATCHTVITRALDDKGNPTGPEVPEQVPFLEWQNSSFSSGPMAQSCANCHVPTLDEDGKTITTQISNRPPFLDARSPVGRHVLVGGNAYMLGVLAENAAWTGTNVPQSEILASAEDTRRMITKAANVRIAKAERANGQLMLEIAVENHSGHKFPTAYPSRRAWIHLITKDATGKVVFESGRFDARGKIVNAQNQRLDGPDVLLPHRDEITKEDEVQVYEAVMSDVSGKPTHVLLRATGYAKDNRLLPAGWSAAHVTAAMTKPVGIGNDPTFVPASDVVTYRFSVPEGALEIVAELLFQTVPPSSMDVLSGVDTAAARTFTAMMQARPPIPERVSNASTTVP